MKIFENDIIRGNILKHLSNADSSNLMEALRPTQCWEHFFKEKQKKVRKTHCPVCLFNLKTPLLENWVKQEKVPINELQYPNEYAIAPKVWEESPSDFLHESKLIYTESSNLHNHNYLWALSIYTDPVLITSYFRGIDFNSLEQFEDEKALISHLLEVSSSNLCMIVLTLNNLNLSAIVTMNTQLIMIMIASNWMAKLLTRENPWMASYATSDHL